MSEVKLEVPEFGEFSLDEDIIRLDLDHPINEFAQFPERIWVYTQLLSRLKTFNMKSKFRIERIEASVTLTLKNNPPPNAKVTDSYIDASVKMDTQYQRAMLDYLKSIEAEEILSSFVKALEKKFSAMQNIAQLQARGL